jgi:hypothetical protein
MFSDDIEIVPLLKLRETVHFLQKFLKELNTLVVEREKILKRKSIVSLFVDLQNNLFHEKIHIPKILQEELEESFLTMEITRNESLEVFRDVAEELKIKYFIYEDVGNKAGNTTVLAFIPKIKSAIERLNEEERLLLGSVDIK